MNKIRVYQLAKELNMGNKELMENIRSLNIAVSSHMSALDDAQIKIVKNTIQKEPKVQNKEAAPRKESQVKPTEKKIENSKVNDLKKNQGDEARLKGKLSSADQGANTNHNSGSSSKQRQDKRDDRTQMPTRKPDSRVQVNASERDSQGQRGAFNSQKSAENPRNNQRTDARREPENKGNYRKDNQGQNRPYQNDDSRRDNRNNRPGQSGAGAPGDNRGGRSDQPRRGGSFDQRRGDAKTYQKDSRPGENRGSQGYGNQRRDSGSKDSRGPATSGSRDNRRPGKPGAGKPGADKATSVVPTGKPTKSNFARKKQDPKKEGENQEIRGKRTGKSDKTPDRSPAYENLHKKSQGKKHRDYKNVDKVKVVEEEKLVTAKDLDGFYEIGETVVVGELARIMDVPSSDIIMSLIKMGIMANINQEIKFETAEKIAAEFDVILMKEEVEVIEEIDFVIEEDDPKDLKPRPPIVTVMGHVDHGKTSLLDAIRNTRVTAGEAGGITQHIGASEVVINEKKIVFLDTPGHAAFTEMRARGAQVTDLVIIVVAADDGIMPQTLEAIDHVKAAGVPMIIAINKIDKPSADVEKVRHELSEKGVLVESWGGEIIDVPISAKAGTNLDTLLEMVLLVAELEELKANPNRKAIGTVVESHLDKGRGPVATVIVQNGTLKVGDSIVAGPAFGKVRAMHNSKGKKIGKAGPSTAVEIIGLGDVPGAGDQLVAVRDEKEARALGEKRWEKRREEQMRSSSKISLEDLFDQMQKGELKELAIIVKADVQGSVEAVRNSLEKISNEEVKVRVIHGGVGAITESDIMLASASNAIIIGFNVRPSVGAKSLSETEKVDLRTYRVIYEAIEDVENAMKGMLAPSFVEEELGKAEVRMPFKVPKIGVVAGSYVKEGKVQRNAKVRLVRDGIVVYEGAMDSLRRFKDDVKEVATGFECGIGLVNFQDIKEGDIIECFIIKEVKAV